MHFFEEQLGRVDSLPRMKTDGKPTKRASYSYFPHWSLFPTITLRILPDP